MRAIRWLAVGWMVVAWAGVAHPNPLHSFQQMSWPPAGLPVALSAGAQYGSVIIGDGSGGAYIAWGDASSATAVPHLQHVTASGQIAPGWPASGRSLPEAGLYPAHPVLAPDGAGGVYFVSDRGDEYGRIIVNRWTAAGSSPSGWPAGGVAVPGFTVLPAPAPNAIAPAAISGAGPGDALPSVALDGSGDLLLAWSHLPFNHDWNTRALRITPDGIAAAGWPSAGVDLRGSWDDQYPTGICPDDSGGAFVVWTNHAQAGTGIYVHHLLATGIVDSRWAAGGLGLHGNGPGDAPGIVADGSGGAIVVWEDDRDGVWQPYIERLQPDGTPAPGWTAGGFALSPFPTAAGPERAFYTVSLRYSSVASDGSGGAIVTWTDFRSDAAGDIYAQRVRGDGSIAAGWPSLGLPICTASGAQVRPVIAADGSGGAMIAWQDSRTGSAAIDAIRITASGAVADGWLPQGRSVSQWLGDQQFPAIAADGTGNALLAWADSRSGIPAIYSIVSPNPGSTAIGPQSPVRGLAVSLRPVPAVGRIAVSFTLQDDSPARLEVWDSSGRRVFAREVEGLGPGEHRFVLDPDLQLAPGMYWCRLAQGGRARVARGVLVR